MIFTFLSPPLHPVAELARDFFADSWGLSASRFRSEVRIDQKAEYCPTLSAETNDNHILCVDVSDKIYTPSLDDFVLQCMNNHLPVKLFVAVPRDAADPDYRANMRKLCDRGVGLLEVGDTGSRIIRQPLSLSLATLTPIDLTKFPLKYREDLQRAEQLFRDGDPVKGCANVLDVIEARTRALAKCAVKKGWFRQNPAFDLDKHSWASVLKFMQTHFDQTAAKCPALTDIFIAQLIGVTPHRNEVSHPPKDVRSRTRRDAQLRTNFEHAINVLTDFVDHTRAVRL